MKFLIVDDNSTIRRLIKNIIGPLADEVYECEDGDQALAAYRSHSPDVVLMDIEMQRGDGITATRQITTADPSAYVVIVTNHDDADLREAASEAGARAYVLKENLFEMRLLLTGR